MAKHDKLKLSIAKADRTTDFPVLKYSSTERGKTVDVTVTDSDGLPYDLSGLNLYFVEELYNGQMIVDDGKEENAGRFVTNADDLKQGKFSYQFQEGVYQYDGWAHFKFMQNDTVIDTTAGFAIKIIDDIDSDLDEKSYIAYFERIKKEHQTAMNSLRELISSAQSLNDSNHSEISVIKGNITDLSNRLNDQVGSLGQRITDVNNALSGRIDTLNNEKNTLSGRVDTLNTEKTELSNKVDDLTSKNGDLTEQLNNSKNEISELKSKVSTLENAGFIKGKFDGFASADEAKQWSQQNHGIAIFDDEASST